MELQLTAKEQLLVSQLRELEETGVGQDLHVNIHLVPIVDFGSEKHQLVLGVSNPVPSQRIRDAMKELMEDVKKGSSNNDFLFLIQYDSSFNILRLLKIDPLINV